MCSARKRAAVRYFADVVPLRASCGGEVPRSRGLRLDASVRLPAEFTLRSQTAPVTHAESFIAIPFRYLEATDAAWRKCRVFVFDIVKVHGSD